MRHQASDFTFEGPPDWLNNTVFAFRSQGPEVHAIRVSSVVLEEGETFETFLARQVVWLAKNLPDFFFIGAQPMENVAGRPATLFSFRHAAKEGVLEKRVAVVDPGGAARRKVAMVSLTTTATPDENANRAFHDVLLSLQFDTEGSARPTGHTIPPYPNAAARSASAAEPPMVGRSVPARRG